MTAGGASSARKAPPGQPWSHQETVALIDAYMEKWYALKRGQLRAQQWEEVAAAIAARCGLLAPPKTGTQCRHKVEKLRKRYRSELSRLPSPSPSPWPYFDSMDRLDRGPLPISVRPPPFSSSSPPISDDDEDDDEYEDDYEEPPAGSNTRSINGILREGNWGLTRQSRDTRPQKRRFFEVEQEEEEEEDDDEDEYDDYEGEDPRRGNAALSELARVVRRFGEGFVRMEKRRMEMMREMERDWMEMEAKRTEMVSESQRCIVETIASAFSSSVKKAKSEDNGEE